MFPITLPDGRPSRDAPGRPHHSIPGRGAMFDIEGFIADCLAARARPDYLAALRERLLTAISRPDEIAAAFAGDQGEETLVHAGPALTLVHVRLSPNVLFPPHNHHMEALIGTYQGGEAHRRYLRRGAGLV